MRSKLITASALSSGGLAWAAIRLIGLHACLRPMNEHATREFSAAVVVPMSGRSNHL
jgi:hypothetical protein